MCEIWSTLGRKVVEEDTCVHKTDIKLVIMTFEKTEEEVTTKGMILGTCWKPETGKLSTRHKYRNRTWRNSRIHWRLHDCGTERTLGRRYEEHGNVNNAEKGSAWRGVHNDGVLEFSSAWRACLRGAANHGGSAAGRRVRWGARWWAGRRGGADHGLSYYDHQYYDGDTCHPLDYKADNTLDDWPPLYCFVFCFVLYIVLTFITLDTFASPVIFCHQLRFVCFLTL